MTLVGGGSALRFTNNPVGFSWTGGTPTATGTNTTTGIYVAGVNRGFRLTVPADTTTRTLTLFVGVWQAQGRLLAQLSDQSAADYTDVSLINATGTSVRRYTLAYRAASAGQTLTVTFTQMGTTGNVTLQAAALAATAADFGLTATPASRTVAAGSETTAAITTAPINGFGGNVALSLAGLPAGTTGSFAPATIDGASGTSTLTLATTASTPAGTFPLTVTGISGGVTRTTPFTLVVQRPDFTLTATPATQTVAAGAPAAFTLSASPVDGFTGVVSLGVTGLPAGTTASFAPATISGGTGASTLTLGTTTGTPAGTFPLTIVATSGSIGHQVPVTLVVVGGSLTGGVGTPAGVQTLSTLGSSDWAHWGVSAATSYTHKTAVTPLISNVTLVGGGTALRFTNNPVGFSWTGGTPTAAATNTTTGIYVAGINRGFRLTVPADTTPRTLTLFVGVWRAQGRLLAQLSDQSAADYTDVSLINATGTSVRRYTLSYRAATAGQTLTVTFTQMGTAGNVTLQAAALAATTGFAAATPARTVIELGGAILDDLSIVSADSVSGRATRSGAGHPTGVADARSARSGLDAGRRSPQPRDRGGRGRAPGGVSGGPPSDESRRTLFRQAESPQGD